MKKLYTFLKKCSAAVLLFLTVITTTQIKADIVGTDRGAPTINIFQDFTWNVISTMPLTMSGYTIERAVSVTWNSDNLKYYVILRTTATDDSRRLATVDPATGVCTDIGDMGYNFASLTYSAETSTMYAMGGTGSGTASNLLVTVNLNTGATTYLAGPFVLGTGGGAIIAYNYVDEHIYHWSGFPVSSMEKIDLNTLLATPVAMTGVTVNEVMGAVYTGTGDFIITDFAYNAFNVTETGAATLQQSGLVFRVRGLGYADGLLPVELASFTSSVNGRNAELNWTTSSESNNSGFDIERSDVKGQTSNVWTKVGSISGNGTSSVSHNYSFTDRNLASGNYSYRLKQTDFNGNFEYFNLSNEVNIGIPDKFELSQNYPNPFNPSTTINYDLPFDSKVNLRIFDMSGKEIATLVNEAKTAGYHTINFDASQLSSGLYFYNISAENFNVTKKMMLIK